MPTDSVTAVSAVGLALTVIMGLLVVALPRRLAIAPVIVLCCYMTLGQAFVVAGCHFTMIRVLLLFGWTRLIMRGEVRRLRLNQIDWIIIGWTLVSFVAYVVLWGTGDSVIYKLGAAYNIIGFYFLFRMLLYDFDDAVQTIEMAAVLIVPLAGFMLLEKSTGRNIFAVFGGVPEITAIREGVLRCTGPFAHPILAGTFGATILPLFVSLWGIDRRGRFLAIVGSISSLVIAVTSGSSGPVLAAGAAILALAMWPLRRNMRLIRRGVIISLICLHFLMKAPVWFVLARVDVFSGSTGYHRALLIDSAIKNLKDWWIVGTKSTAAWEDEDQHLFDVTNQYIVVGSEGGFLSLLLFIWIIVRSFRYVGLSEQAAEEWGRPLSEQFVIWGFGASLFAHAVSYMSVSYFDQNIVNWYLLLAIIATTGHEFLSSPPYEEAALSDASELSLPLVTPSGFAAGSRA